MESRHVGSGRVALLRDRIGGRRWNAAAFAGKITCLRSQQVSGLREGGKAANP